MSTAAIMCGTTQIRAFRTPENGNSGALNTGPDWPALQSAAGFSAGLLSAGME
jgi:hypothetical protein